MGSKYYTPEIEEFHVGFEYEFQDGGEWMKLKWNADVTIIGRLLEPIVRVKYLDKEDIESLGWKYDEEESKRFYLAIQGFLKTTGATIEETIDYDYNGRGFYYLKSKLFEYTLDFRSPENIWIREGDNFPITYGNEIFKGAIKNKSELKKLLKQLGI